MFEKYSKLLRIEIWGKCYKCEKWINLDGKTSFPKHNGRLRKCRNSGYSASVLEYRINTQTEAIRLAEFIRDDNGNCLSSGNERCSLNCGDGRDCKNIRQLLSQALAEYFLKHNKI